MSVLEKRVINNEMYSLYLDVPTMVSIFKSGDTYGFLSTISENKFYSLNDAKKELIQYLNVKKDYLQNIINELTREGENG